ncbi:MAG: DNA-processing protein DprA [Candidatus Hydrothermia bacterium]
MDAHIAKLWSIRGIGQKSYTKLVNALGSANKVFQSSPETLKNYVNGKIVEEITNIQEPELKHLQNYLEKRGIRAIDFTCAEYPVQFLDSEIYPPVLFLKGQNLKSYARFIGVVGSRRPTWYGIEVTKKLIKELTKNGFTIVSGGARGIDTVAHKTAIEEGGTTIAVLGSGFNHIYPFENKMLFSEIEKQGTLITEFPLDTKPLRDNFPKRNRIIAGLSEAIVVIEAGERSGALITARWGAELGREVYAVPGPITSPLSTGTNRLISQGARILTEIADILEDLGIKEKDRFSTSITPTSATEKMVLETLSCEPLHFDKILETTKLPPHELLSVLFELELKNLAKELPGKFYVKI